MKIDFIFKNMVVEPQNLFALNKYFNNVVNICKCLQKSNWIIHIKIK